jgi:hypothetical protein
MHRYKSELKNRTLKRGQQRLRVHRNKEADPSPSTTTPSECPEDADEMGRLEEVSHSFNWAFELTIS